MLTRLFDQTRLNFYFLFSFYILASVWLWIVIHVITENYRCVSCYCQTHQLGFALHFILSVFYFYSVCLYCDFTSFFSFLPITFNRKPNDSAHMIKCRLNSVLASSKCKANICVFVCFVTLPQVDELTLSATCIDIKLLALPYKSISTFHCGVGVNVHNARVCVTVCVTVFPFTFCRPYIDGWQNFVISENSYAIAVEVECF